MREFVMKALLTAPLLVLAGCASMGSAQNDPGMDLADAQVAVRTEANGDVIEEYRLAGQLRMVKVTPSRGPAYYLMDENGDGRLDKSKGEGPVSPVYWKLYGW
jgi:hypothetical protein